MKWTKIPLSLSNAPIQTLNYANGLWLLGVDSGAMGLWSSVDGKNWVKGNSVPYRIRCLSYFKGLWICATQNGIYYSSDGKNWTQSNVTRGVYRCMISANGRLVAISLSSSITKYTDDGITWHSSSAYDSYARWTNSIYNANGLWVIATSIGLYYSSDATTWTKSNITSGEFRSVYNANGIWVVANYGAGIYYSFDGKNWTQSNITSGNFGPVYNANGIWVAGSYGNGLYYSVDGKNWTQSNNISGNFISVYNANSIWIAISYDEGLFYSTDGKSWTQSNIIQSSFNYSEDFTDNFVKAANGIWVAITGEKNCLYYSSTWEPTIPASDYKFILPLSAPSGNIMENIPFIANSINYTSLSVIQN